MNKNYELQREVILPKVENTYFKEREGVIKVGLILNQLGLIFRETQNADVGIDGTIEYVTNDGKATGEIIAVQIKSGQSYFNHENDTNYKFYFDKKHLVYWENFPIPLIVLMYNPANKNIYYIDARHYLRNPNNIEKAYIEINKSNIVKNKIDIFRTLGKENEIDYFIDNDKLLKHMIVSENDSGDLKISFLDLFVGGITNLGRHLFFNIELAHNLVEIINEPEANGFGEQEHYFLHEYAKFLLNQNLIYLDYSDYLIDWEERRLQPQFLASFTNRGRFFLRYLNETICNLLGKNDISLLAESDLNINVYYKKVDEMKKIKLLYKKDI